MVAGMKIPIKDPQKNFKIERLKALGATTFTGTTDPSDAKIWMDMLEKCFDIMGCPEDRKVRLATFLLQEGASDWWESVRSKRSKSQISSWSEFKKAFYEEYYLQSYKDAKRSEFLKLVQGSSNTKKQVIGSPISILGPISEQRESTFSHDRYSQCQSYGKIHQDKCLKGTNICYDCGQSSDMKREYPLLMQRGNVLQGSFSQPEQSNVQVGQAEQYTEQARSTMKGSEAQWSTMASSSESKSRRQVGTPRTHGKMFAMTQQEAPKSSK